MQQWCRCAIIVDSDLDEVKYILELTPEGFVRTEFISKALQWRAGGQIFGIKRLISPLTPEQSLRLRDIADQISTKLSPESGNYRNIFD